MYLHPNKFEHYMMQHIDTHSTTTESEGIVTLLEVYVDEFIAIINNTSHAHLLQIYRAMLHGVHAISPPPSVTVHNRFNPVALYKLDTGEDTWEHVKYISGWIMDGLNGTMQSPVKNARKYVS